MAKKKFSVRAIARIHGFRSGFENIISDSLTEKQIPFTYESEKISYIIPERAAKYTPDFVLIKKDGTKMYIESKGRLLPDDKKKMQLIKVQYPNLDIRILFSSGKTKMSKKSKTTYAMWAEKLRFPWAEKIIPEAWLNECI